MDTNLNSEQGKTQLHVAASTGNVDVLKYHLSQADTNVDQQDLQGNTALNLAAACSDLEAVRLLLDANADPTIKNFAARGPLENAKSTEVQALLKSRMFVTNEDARPVKVSRQALTAQIQSALPKDPATVRLFAIDLFVTEEIILERCRELIRQLIEEKQIANHKSRLLEAAVGLKDKETAERFMDQLQHWQDENERQAATITYLKIRIQMLENASLQQEEYYRKNLSDVIRQHSEELQAAFKRNEETESSLMELQQKNAETTMDLARLRADLNVKAQSQSDLTAVDGGAKIRQDMAKLQAEKTSLEERVKLADKLKAITDTELADLRTEVGKLRNTRQEEMFKQIETAVTTSTHTVQGELDEKEETNIVYIKGEGQVKRIKCGTPEKLIEKLINPTSFDNQFMQAFLMTHTAFMPSKDVMSAFITKYAEASGDDVSKTYLRLINSVKYWVDTYWSDFVEDPSLQSMLTTFVDSIKTENMANILKKVIQRKQTGAEPRNRMGTNDMNAGIMAPPPKPVLPKFLAKKYSDKTDKMLYGTMNAGMLSSLANDGVVRTQSSDSLGSQSQNQNQNRVWSFGATRSRTSEDGVPIPDIPIKIPDLDPMEMARQLTLIEFELFSNIKPREYLDMAWMKEDKEVRAPNITRMTRWSNHVIHWLVTEIVIVKESAKARAIVLEKFIQLAISLEKLNNFNGVKEVLAALQSSSVYRLKKTKEQVSSKLLKALTDLEKLTASDMNYKSLRAKVHAADPPLIPFPGVYQGDLVFLEECSKEKLENGMINFSKYQKTAGYITELQTYQQTPYNFEMVAEIQDYIKHYPIFDDDVAYSHSLQCEARATT
ncbi:hypothetical protein SmJEL517_g00744 [Synchytrium microbalum]|uniref:Ras-GEF domain-containing protein n=1 Tax=Synchytrium microbalum TaxID=1806994 RepID=A0A507CD65_9FUNG|nr:uncharacterized protein SmJEL517_g00744 [Synchytrium microbalum]TPX37441.1 hypothetical protein SmJEL517_g00744 [Synchytrium microbalum]